MPRVYCTGDTHADFRRFFDGSFRAGDKLTREDIVLVAGDFGLWNDDSDDKARLDSLESLNYTIAFVDGNHECFDRLYSDEFEIVDFHDGKAHKIRENVFHLMRGYVFNFGGKKFFAFGGASSHDIDDGILDPNDFETKEDFMKVYKKWSANNYIFRISHLSWWKEELPSQEEMDFGMKTLKEHSFEVDYVITHCLPQSIANMFGFYGGDILTKYFDNLLDKGLKFKQWHCGHYHKDDCLGEYHIHYRNFERLI